MDPFNGEDEAYRHYCRKVELAWSLARGCQIIVSPLEFEELDRWYQAEIPLPVVLHAIEVFVEKKRKAKRPRAFLLKDAACTVEKCLREYRDIHAGETEEGDLLEQKKKALVRKLNKVAKEAPELAPALAACAQRIQDLNVSGIVDFDSLDAGLGALEDDLITGVKAAMAEEDVAEIRGEVEEFLSEDEDPEFFAKMFRDAVRARFGIPRLSLLG